MMGIIGNMVAEKVTGQTMYEQVSLHKEKDRELSIQAEVVRVHYFEQHNLLTQLLSYPLLTVRRQPLQPIQRRRGCFLQLSTLRLPTKYDTVIDFSVVVLWKKLFLGPRALSCSQRTDFLEPNQDSYRSNFNMNATT
jgi:hypothetical protein